MPGEPHSQVDDDLAMVQSAKARRRTSMQFHMLRQQLLSAVDNDYFMRVLTDYAQVRRPDRLALALKAIIDTKEKRALVEMMCETLIPPAHKAVGCGIVDQSTLLLMCNSSSCSYSCFCLFNLKHVNTFVHVPFRILIRFFKPDLCVYFGLCIFTDHLGHVSG